MGNKSKAGDSNNPFTNRTPPPSDSETAEQMTKRIKQEEAAQQVSKEIDEILYERKKYLEKKRKAVQILLLGQSESGKSSILKNFHLAFAPKAFQKEREVWRTVIQLNLISSIKRVLDILKEEWEPEELEIPTTPDLDTPLLRNLRRMRLGLSPLIFLENTLTHSLAPELAGSGDVCVRAGTPWKSLLNLRRPSTASSESRRKTSSSDPSSVLVASRDNIVALWEDQAVQEVLKRRELRLEFTSGFFLHDARRIASEDYVPTDADIVRARVRTMGAEEHQLTIEKGEQGLDSGSDIYVTDVGGSRSARQSWIPFFESVNAILFIAPLAFNETLEEDPRVNRLEDSFSLWREICSSKLLMHAQLILFLNKKDVLSATLEAGVTVKKYVPSYNMPNDVLHVTKYFREKFHAYLRKLSPKPRPFMCYETSALDTSATAAVLVGVREIIIRQQLEDAQML
ncbi:heterotrimeric GTP-binding alpha subunit [Pluteus cervinus]|uniref:Heterotrimeric GTP-binding alpha subunit n=1 Tax=Pluteus cervinus TaxID=181527 RepID=A0ACD3B3Q9_9AGAR|nr:heterotrimeric GTP-binding alpha subunit [Pluteus cervinus]